MQWGVGELVSLLSPYAFGNLFCLFPRLSWLSAYTRFLVVYASVIAEGLDARLHNNDWMPVLFCVVGHLPVANWAAPPFIALYVIEMSFAILRVDCVLHGFVSLTALPVSE